MSNLIPLEDAARMLGLSVDKLNEMRSNSEIFGYKDGTSWKFKMQEIERVAQEFDIRINSADAVEEVVDLVDDDFEISLEEDDDDLAFDLSDSGADLIQEDSIDEIEIVTDDAPKVVEEQGVLDLTDDEDDDIEIIDLEDDEELSFSLDDDDQELGVADDDDAIELVEDDDLAIASEEDDFQLKSDSDDLDLVADDESPEELSLGSSDINLAGSGEESIGPENTGDLLGSNLDDDLVLASGPATGDLLADDEADSGLLLSEDDLFEDDLKIHESHEDDIDLSSDFEDSSDLIMEDSDSSEGSVVLGDDDSGFELGEDSAEIDLGGSLMDLAGEDDDEMIVLDEPASADAATEIADDDFNLTPLEEVVSEDSSGSQIIALEDSDMFSDESAATLLSPSDELEAEPMLTEDAMDVGDFGAFDAGVAGMAPGMAINPGAVGALPEQPYTLYQVVSLGLVLFLLLVGGMVGYDLARNLWLPDDQIISGGILPTILNLVGG